MEETAKNTPAVPAASKQIQAKPTNCAKCNKVLKKKIWYYKNGKYYCNKACWRASLAKTEKTPAAA